MKDTIKRAVDREWTRHAAIATAKVAGEGPLSESPPQPPDAQSSVGRRLSDFILAEGLITLEQFKGQPLPPKAVCMGPERVAEGVIHAVERGRFRVYLPWFTGLTPLVKSVAPEFVRRQTLRVQPLTVA